MDNPVSLRLFTAIGCIGVLLQLAVIYLMSRSALPRYWGAFLYLTVLFLTSVCDMAAYLNPDGYPDWYLDYWRINNLLRHLSGFVAVISLIFVGTAAHPARGKLRAASLFGTVAVLGISMLFPEATAGETATRVWRDLSFTTILLNVILWASLIRARHDDLRLFFVSGGLGVNMAGEAIAQSLVMLDGNVVFCNLLAVGTHLFCLTLWIRAFRIRAVVDERRPKRASHLGTEPAPDPNLAARR